MPTPQRTIEERTELAATALEGYVRGSDAAISWHNLTADCEYITVTLIVRLADGDRVELVITLAGGHWMVITCDDVVHVRDLEVDSGELAALVERWWRAATANSLRHVIIEAP